MPSRKGRELDLRVTPSYDGVLLLLEGRIMCLTPEMALRFASELVMAASAISAPDALFIKPHSEFDIHG